MDCVMEPDTRSSSAISASFSRQPSAPAMSFSCAWGRGGGACRGVWDVHGEGVQQRASAAE